MNRFRRALAATLLAGLAAAAALHAVGEGRVLGVVKDTAGAPVAGATATITSPEFKFELKKTSDAKGKFTLVILDATRKYVIRVEKEGYVSTQGPLDVKLGENTEQTYTLEALKPGQTTGQPSGTPAQGTAPKELSGADKAVNVFNEGVAAFKAGDAATAVAKFKEAEQLDPKQAAAPGALADVYLSQKQYADAEGAAERFLALKPNDPRGLRDRYDAYKGAGDKEKAKTALDALVAADPSRDTAVLIYNAGAEAQRAGQNEVAIANLNRAIEIDPKMEPAYTGLATVYENQKNYPQALATLDKLAQVDPQSADGFRIRSEVYHRMALSTSDKKKAREYEAEAQKAKEGVKTASASKVAAAGSSPDAVFNQGVALFNANNVPEATKVFEKVLDMKPTHARAHYMLGLCYVNQGDSAKAKEYLSKFIQLAPTDPDVKTAKEMLASL
ncbi:MAG TPA: tetratricopeptide repeat protein [Thermoanaerobaculia bacterium]|jgi:tetratricopeptide (TPR) repeat protein